VLMGRKIDGVLQRCSFLLPVISSFNVSPKCRIDVDLSYAPSPGTMSIMTSCTMRIPIRHSRAGGYPVLSLGLLLKSTANEGQSRISHQQPAQPL
jgi:hypothetical protein